MHKTLQEICNSLDSLSESILNGWKQDEKISDHYGWNYPHLTRHDLALISSNLSLKIKSLALDNISEELELRIENIPVRLEDIKTSVVVHFYNGHGKDSVPVYMMTMNWVEIELSPLFDWEALSDNKALPSQLVKRLSGIQNDLESLMPDKEEVAKSLKTIREATETIENLPSDIDVLKEAKKNIEKYEKSAHSYSEKINSFLKESETDLNVLKENRKNSDRVLEHCEEVYRITTTKGLAGAFDTRAKELKNSMWSWVGMLIVALGVGGWIGSLRFETLTDLLKAGNLNTGFIVMEFVLCVLSIGAPVWFAWIATKQITQRFKLAEDYGFKASVAKAYEGYKKEATRLDFNLEKRLFDSALTRLEEAPLRLMDDKTPGSPWQELIDSEGFKKAINNAPELRGKVLEIVRGKGVSVGKKVEELTQQESE